MGLLAMTELGLCGWASPAPAVMAVGCACAATQPNRHQPVLLHPVACAEYCQANAADYPWYAFGDDFEGERRALLEDYSVPAMFR